MDGMNDGTDPALIAILAQLWRAAQETPGRAWSLAKLSKQSGVPMSSLIRQLTALSDAALLEPPDPENASFARNYSRNRRRRTANSERSCICMIAIGR
jgi:hypothetical protein